MPRQSRIDAPGALHHIITRGNEKRNIFEDKKDYEEFLARLGDLLTHTQTICYAWALMPNHFHLFLRTGIVPISTIMRRLLTRYAVYFNHRHRRYGHLFQNRYKSILCQEDPYFLELVRYIHLNPLRANLVKSLISLDKYPYAGHSAVMGRVERQWQDTDYVLEWFGKRKKSARSKYHDFIKKGLSMGKRPDLTGGGLVRSAGGWLNLVEMRKAKAFIKGDERILGEGAFVEQVLQEAGEVFEKKSSWAVQGWDIDKLAQHVAKLLAMDISDVWSTGKYRPIVRARSLLCYWAARELGMSMAAIARRLGISTTAVMQSVTRGEKLVKENAYRFP
ncbi:MAG: transposase [Deltaproteobacteria bacterium]|nr:transposase [Deltaproteobacteria bacterium]